MADRDLDLFVREALLAGQSREAIARALDEAGWAPDQAGDALAAYAQSDFPVPVPRPRRYGSAREAFVYIVYFVLLGVVSGYAVALAFAFINALFRDDLFGAYWQGAPSILSWGIAALLVSYPIFLYLGARLGAARRANPERRGSRVRAWLTYVTMIFAALVLIGDLISVLYHFLRGGLATEFIAKAMVVGAVCAAILWNFGRDAERSDASVDWPGRILAAAASVIVAALVLWAFTIVRTPQAARERHSDEARLRDLGALVRLVDCHYTYEGALPATLDALDETLSARSASKPVASGCGVSVPNDPTTRLAYEYAPLSAQDYRICMTFQRGWFERTRPDRPRRRALQGAGGPGERRYVSLPLTLGEACFNFTAVDIATPDEADGE